MILQYTSWMFMTPFWEGCWPPDLFRSRHGMPVFPRFVLPDAAGISVFALCDLAPVLGPWLILITLAGFRIYMSDRFYLVKWKIEVKIVLWRTHAYPGLLKHIPLGISSIRSQQLSCGKWCVLDPFLGVPVQCQRLQFYSGPWCQRFYRDFMLKTALSTSKLRVLGAGIL